MNPETDYLETNRALWDAKTPVHVASEFYNVPEFIAGKNTLHEIELPLLGDVRGKEILHLQCHFGLDSLSLARMGAKVTGVDFSAEAIEQARTLNEQLGLGTQFICTDVYSLPDELQGTFDIVFTSYGVLGWLPDMARWAAVVSHFLKPGGMLVLVEFHPVVWMFNPDFSKIAYSYFNKEAIVETLSGTYAAREAGIQQAEIGWNHSMSEVLQSLINAGLSIAHVSEFDYSPHNCFQNMVKREDSGYYLSGLEEKMPLVYAVRAVK